MEKVKLKNSEVWVDGDILMIKMSGEATYEEMDEITNASADLVKKFKLKYILVDSDVRKMSLSARKKNFTYVGAVTVEKIAFICANPVTRAIAMFLVRGYKLEIPVRLFSNAEDAKKWFSEEKKA